MGWSNCGTDSKGRPIGYAFEATCYHPGCTEEIDRGLGHACGGMHGEDVFCCEGYFCSEHLYIAAYDDECFGVCEECLKLLEQEDEE